MRVVSLTRRLIYSRRKKFPVLIGMEAGDPTGSPESLETSKTFSLIHSRTKIPDVQLSVSQIAIHRNIPDSSRAGLSATVSSDTDLRLMSFVSAR